MRIVSPAVRVLVVGALLFGGARAGELPADPVEDFVRNAIPGLAQMTVADAGKLGALRKMTSQKYPSDWVEGAQVEIRTLVFDGAELRFAVHEGRRDFLVGATFTGTRWKLRGGLAVGVRKEAVLKVLGPKQQEGKVLAYTSNEAPHFAVFTVEAGVVTRIELTPYTG